MIKLRLRSPRASAYLVLCSPARVLTALPPLSDLLSAGERAVARAGPWHVLYFAGHGGTTPHVCARMTTVTKDLLDRQHRHLTGLIEVATDQFAHQINQDITPVPPGQLQMSNIRGAGTEQDTSEAFIREMLLDFFENPSKLTGPDIPPPNYRLLQAPDISPAIVMPKEGEQPAQEPGEHRTQPEHIGIPFRGAETLFRRDDEQALSNRVAELERQLAEARQETQQARVQLAEARREQVELKQQLAEERQEQAELKQQLAEAQDTLARQRERKAASQRQWQERHPDVGRRLNREWRARQRQNRSLRSTPELLELDADPKQAEQQRRRQRKAEYMREWRARNRQNLT